ncbi:MAG TPA: 5-oxoprolinase subunit PxpB [Gemmatimonadaceae bacterium]|nr:5-oxoprolinase subunit PxpB [Gemmatimonadaceae bacterium]
MSVVLPRIAPFGDRALVVTLGDRIDDATFQRVQGALARLGGASGEITDVVAGFASITVHYEPLRVAMVGAELPHVALARTVASLLDGVDAVSAAPGRLVEIPVCYEGELAPDLEEVARHTGMSSRDVVRLHSAAEYVVHMIGFVPGFPYLGGLDARLATPRRAEPRTRVPAGSVGIGGAQTGVYPIASPGGWQLIGRTPLRLFDARRESPSLLHVGDRVRFRVVTRREFDALVAR